MCPICKTLWTHSSGPQCKHDEGEMKRYIAHADSATPNRAQRRKADTKLRQENKRLRARVEQLERERKLPEIMRDAIGGKNESHE